MLPFQIHNVELYNKRRIKYTVGDMHGTIKLEKVLSELEK